FDRSVEDVTGGQYLIRDLVEPNGYITDHGASSLVQTAYNLKSKYRTVSSSGVTLVNNVAFTPGDHFGFPVPQFPNRRVNIGDSWESHIQVALGWSAIHPTTITGTAKLDSFEWQNGYPTAKIIETYDGPATFDLTMNESTQNQATAQGQPRAQTVDASNVHISRTIWFAYNSGRIVHMETSMTVSADMTAEQVTALGGTTGAGMGALGAPPYAQAGGPPPNVLAMMRGGGYGRPGFTGPPVGGAPFGPPPGMGYMGPGGPGGGFMGPPGFTGPNMAPNAQNQPKSPQKLELTDTTSLLGVR
ncbi:MAG TPA: hypothetical protein VFW40_03920, partial [Capsulimonadaceae bacterium]|nr:hypothetical protein [Capsulimonadaceae bacterium]